MTEDITKVILVRHGETDYNLRGIFQGSSDIPLNERGKKQAGYAREALKDEKIDGAYSSPLSRAYETAEIIMHPRETKVIPEEGLRETCVGVWEGVPFEQLMEEYPKQFKTWMENPVDFSVEGSESLGEVGKRTVRTFNKIVEENRGKTILIVSHMVALTTIMLHVAGIDFNKLWDYGLINAGINIIEVKNGEKPEIKLWNGDSHIPENERLKKPFEEER